MNIAEQVDAIISKRNEQANKVAKVLKKLQALRKNLSNINRKREEYLSDSDVNLFKGLEQVNFQELINEINKQIEVIENLKDRLSRPTLNIGVVGKMRQGKSRLLQSLTGLGEEAIPTGSAGVCTSGLSKIFNDDNRTEPQNQIIYHSWNSLQEILHLYFDKLDLPSDSKPLTPDDLETDNIPGLPDHRKGDIESQFQYGHLRKDYYGGYQQYRSLINRPPEIIDQEDIIKHITEIKENHKITNWEYLATKLKFLSPLLRTVVRLMKSKKKF